MGREEAHVVDLGGPCSPRGTATKAARGIHPRGQNASTFQTRLPAALFAPPVPSTGSRPLRLMMIS